VRVENCTFLNATAGSANTAYYILLQNAVSNVRILNNTFTDALRTPIYIGDNVYANQDTWSDIWVVGNTITGVSASAAPAYAFGILIYGRDVLVDGNEVSGVDGPSSYNASNGAYGIYTKARFCRIVNNNVTSIGVSTNAPVEELRGINVKGADRAATDQPQGYNTLVANNVVRLVGVLGTSGYGISLNHSDIACNNNVVEEAGLKSIYCIDTAASAAGSTTVISNVIYSSSGAAVHGIEVVPWGSAFTVTGNVVNVPGHCIRVRSNTNAGGNVVISGNITKAGVGIRLTAATVNLSNVTVVGNNTMGGTNGLYFDESGGGVISDVLCADNDLSGSTTKVFGLPATGVRLQNNIGYVNAKGGTSAGITTGGTIAHGLAAVPTVWSVIPTAAATDVYVTADATNLTVTFGGGGTVAFAWEAKTASFYA
jgi:hypothetical protein